MRCVYLFVIILHFKTKSSVFNLNVFNKPKIFNLMKTKITSSVGFAGLLIGVLLLINPVANAQIQTVVTIGTGTTQNTSSDYPAPYGNWYWGARHQFIIPASEIIGAGGYAGNIQALAFDVATIYGTPLSNFEILLGTTTATDLSSWHTGTMTSVYLSTSYTETLGWNTHAFTAPFNWDGTSNLIVETCFNNGSYTGNASVNQTTTSYTSTMEYHGDNATVCTTQGTNSYSQRPNIRLTIYGFPPTCPPPSNITASNIYPTSLDLNWTENGSATLWQVEGVLAGNPQGTGLTGITNIKPVPITNLTSSTAYSFYVRSICSPGDTSAWVGPYTVTTAFQCPSNAVCATYTTGDIASDFSFTAIGQTSTCPGSIFLTVPTGMWIDNISTSYDFTSTNSAYMSEQRSWLYCPTTLTGEPAVYAGVGSSTGTYSYTRTGIDIANHATGTVEIQMHAGRTWGGSGCDPTYAKVDNGTWMVIAYLSPIPANDAELVEILPNTEGCNLGLQPIAIRIANMGMNPINGNLTASYKLEGSPSVVTQPVTTPIPVGDTITFTFSTPANFAVTTADSTFGIISWVNLLNDNNQVNDTATSEVVSLFSPPPPIVSDTSINYGTSVTLTAQSNYTVLWFASDTASTELATGLNFTTPILTSSTTYWAAAASSTQVAGSFLSPGAYTGGTTCGGGFMVDITALNGNVTINALGIHCNTAGSQTVNFFYRVGTWVGYAANAAAWIPWGTYTVNSAGSSAETMLTINPLDIPQGQTYAIYWQVSSQYGSLSTNTTYANNDIAVLSGMGHCTNWDGCCSPRQWNGRIIYTVGSPGCFSTRVPVAVTVGPPPADDAGVVDIVSPAGTVTAGAPTPIQVRVVNYGTAVLSSVIINYSINGVTKAPFPVTGLSLAPNDTSSAITIGTDMFSPGTNFLQAWTTMPNGVADVIHYNDTADATIIGCLSGTYTIGGIGADYASFNDAVADMLLAGICGPVVFNVNPGTYTEQVSIPSIPGASAANTVTFQSATGDSTSVVLTGSGAYILQLNGADYITINKITVQSTATSSTKGIEILGGADNNTISNCVVDMLPTSTSSVYGIYNSSGLDNNNTVMNNRILNSYYSIYWYGSSTSSLEIGTVIESNIIEGFYYYGIRSYYQDAMSIKNNTLTNATNSGTCYGMYLYYLDNATQIVANNVILSGTSTLYGIRPYYCDGTSSTPGLIANNFVALASTSTKYGLYVYYSSYQNIYHNSVNTNGTGTSYGLYLYNSTATYTGHNITNNIFSTTSSSGGYAAYVYSNTYLTSSDYNNFYSTGPNFVYWAAARANLAALQTYSGKDVHSISSDPLFNSPTDLHTLAIATFQAGTPLPQVTDDIDGQPRDPVAPCIGADEYILYLRDAGITELTSVPVCPGINTVKVNIKNIGIQSFTGATIHWSVNGVAQAPVNYAGTLAPGAVDEVTLGNYSFAAGVLYDLVFYSSNPGGLADQNPVNDTLIMPGFQTALVGTYTIGAGTGYDFNSFGDAVSALTTLGLCGPVTFNVAAGTYAEQISIPEIIGASATNTITFQAANGDSSSVILSGSSAYIVQLNGADFVHFNKLTIQTTATSSTKVVEFLGGANNNTISNCVLEAPPTNTNSCYVIYNSTGLDENNTIIHNRILNAYYSMYWYGGSSTSLEAGNRIEGNIFEGFYYYGIYSYGQNAIIIKDNTLSNAANSSTVYGIYLHYNDNDHQTTGNKVLLSGTSTLYGINIYYSDGTASLRGLTANNFVSIKGNSTQYGIRNYYSSNQDLYFNSVHVYGTGATGYPLYLYNTSTSYTDHNIVNNIFNTTTSSGYAAYYYSGTNLLSSDYNDFYKAGTPLVYWGVAIADLPTLQATSGKDLNSVSTLPPFTSNTDLHLAGVQLSNIGQFLADVPTDIDGTPRGPNPTIGAHELPLLPFDAGVSAINSPNASMVINEGDVVPVSVVVTNYGTNTITSVTVGYTVNNGAPITQTFTTSITPTATSTFTLPTYISPVADVTIKAFTMLTGDAYAFNDTSQFTYFAHPLYDAEMVEILPVAEGCGLTTDTIVVKIANQGVAPINGNLMAYYKLDGSMTSVSQAVLDPIPVGDTLLFTFTTQADFSVIGADSVFTIIAWVDLLNDNMPMNDEATLDVASLHIPVPPVLSAAHVPYGTQATLVAQSNYDVNWYDSFTSTTILATAPTYVTPPLFDSATYWAEAVHGGLGSGANIGLLAVSTHSGGGSTTYGPQNYNDGNIPGYGVLPWGWVSTSGWIEYTWPAPVTFNAVKFYKDNRPMTTCTFQYWDGSAYIDFYNYNSTVIDDSVSFPPITSTNLRFNTIAGSSNPNFREIQVFEPMQSGCYSSRVPVTANIIPTATAITANTTICYGSSINLQVALTGTSPWTLVVTDGTNIDTLSGIITPTYTIPVSPITATTYSVLSIADYTNTYFPSTATVTIGVYPQLLANAGPDVDLCIGSATFLNANGVGGAGTYTGYQWSPVTGLSNPNAKNPQATPAVTTTYTVTVTDANGCQATDQVVVDVQPLPVVDAGADAAICLGTSTQLTALATGGSGTYVSYAWSPAAGLSATNFYNPTASPVVNTTYGVTVTDSKGCVGNDHVTVSVVEADAGLNQAICYGGSAYLQATGTGGSGNLSYSWTPVTGLSDPNIANPVASPLVTTTYTVHITDNVTSLICTDVVVITVHPLPVVSFSGLASDYCVDAAPAMLVGSPSGGTFTGTGISGNTFNPAIAGVGGPYSITYTYTDMNGCTNTDVQTVTVNPLPVVSFTGLATGYCYDAASVQLTGTPAGGTFSGPGISASTFTPATAGTGVKTITYSYTDINGCFNSVSHNTTVWPMPVATAISDFLICIGSPAILDVNVTIGQPPYTYAWTPADSLDNATLKSPTSIKNLSSNYTVVVTDAHGCQATDSVYVTVVPNPIANAGPDVAYCEGGSAQLIASGGDTYVWSPTIGLSNPNIANPIASPTATTLYEVTVTSQCGTATDFILVTVHPNPVVSLGADIDLCYSTTTYLAPVVAGSQPFSYSWAPATGLSATTGPIVAATPLVNTTYNVTVTDVYGCVGGDDISITILPLPVVDAKMANGDQFASYCTGANVANLTAVSVPPMVTYQWSPVSLIDGFPNNQSVTSFILNSSVNFSVIGTDANGCKGYDTVRVAVLNVDAGPDTEICFGQSTQLMATTTDGIAPWTYTWSPAAGLSATNIANPMASPAVTTTYTVVITDAYGAACNDEVVITVNPLPIVTVADLHICEGTGENLIANVTSGHAPFTYAWTPGTGLSDPTIFNPVANPLVTTQYSIVVTDDKGCIGSTDAMVYVEEIPTVDAGLDAILSAGGIHPLMAVGQGGTTPYSFLWSPAASLNNPTLQNPLASPTITTTYTVTLTDVWGCSATDGMVITTYNIPIANAGPDQTICLFDSAQLNASGGTTYLWSPIDGLSDPTIYNPKASPSVTTTYTVVVTSPSGSAADWMVVNVNPLPAVSFTGLGADYCEDDPAIVALTGTPAGGTFSGPGIVGNDFYPAVPGPGAHLITYTYTDGNGCTNSETQNVLIRSLPVISAGADFGLCFNDLGVLHATPTNYVSYSWNSNQGMGSIYNPNSHTTTISPFNTTIYTVSVVDQFGCANSSSVTVTVNPLPATPSFAGLGAVYCVDAMPVTLTGTPSGGAFTGPGMVGNDFNPSLAGPGTHTITYTYTDMNGCHASTSGTVTVNPLPVLTASNFATSDLVHVEVWYGSNYSGENSWEIVDGANNIMLNGGPGNNNTFSYNGYVNLPTGNYTFNAFDSYGDGWNGGGYYNVTTSLTTTGITYFPSGSVQQTPFTVSGVSNYCEDSAPVTLTVTPAGGIFSGPGIVNGNQFDPTIAGPGSHTLTYTYTDVNGCTNSISDLAIVHAILPATITGLNPFYCIDEPIATLTGFPAGGVFTGPGMNGNEFNPALAGTGTHPITYSYTDPYGCFTTITESTTVNPLPVITPINFVLASPDNVLIEVWYGSWASENSWEIVNTVTNAIVLSGAPGTSNAWSYNGTLAMNAGSYEFRAYDSYGDGWNGNGYYNITTSTSSTGIVYFPGGSVQQTPFNVASGTVNHYCIDGLPVTLDVTPTGGTFSGTGIVSGNQFDPGVAGLGVHLLSYAYTDLNGCSEFINFAAQVHPVPTVSFTGLASPYCESDAPATLTGSPVGGVFTGPGITGNTFDPGLAGAGVHTITYNFTDAYGCTNTTSQTVTVIEAPVVNAGVDQTICLGYPASLNVTATGGAQPYIYEWSPAATLNNAFITNPIANPLVTTTYTVTVTDNNGCFGTDQIVINVTDIQVTTVDEDICYGDYKTLTINVNGGTAPFTYAWSPIGSLIGNNLINPVANPTVTTTYTVVVTDADGCIGTEDLVVTVHPIPAVTFTGLGTIYCQNAPDVTLTGNPSGGTFSGDGITGTTFSPMAAGPGHHIITYTFADTYGCSNSESQSVFIYPLPQVSFTGLGTDYCIDGPVVTDLTGIPAGGTFSGAGVTGNTFDPGMAGVGIHTVSYTVVDGNGCSNTYNVIVNVHALPVITFTTLNLCVDNPGALLTHATPAGGTYSGFAVNNNYFYPVVAGVGIHPVTYSYTDMFGCTSVATDDIYVNGLPIPAASSNAPLCELTTLIFNGSGTGGYTASTGLTAPITGWSWSGPANFSSNIQNPQIIPATLASDGIYTLTVTDGNGCAASATTGVTVYPLPPVTFTGLAPNICIDAAPVLTGIPAGGTFSGPGISGNTFTASVAGLGTHAITYTYTDGNGCTNGSTQSTTVHPLPVVTWVTTLNDICVNAAPVVLSGGDPAGGIYSGPGVSAGMFDPALAGAGSQILTYSYTDGNGCINHANHTVLVNPQPVLTFSMLPDLCYSDAPYPLTEGLPAGGTYSGNGVTGGIFDPSVAGTGTHTITYTYTDANSCTNSITQTILVKDNPVLVMSNATDICYGQSTQLNVTASGGGGSYTYLWAPIASLDDETLMSPTASPLTATTYTVTVAGINGCASSGTVAIGVNPLPMVNAGPDVIICEGYSTVLTATVTPTGTYTYLWNNPSTLNDANLVSPTATPPVTTTYVVTVTDQNGCSGIDEVIVTVDPNPVPVITGLADHVCLNTPVITLAAVPAGGTFYINGIVATQFDAATLGLGVHSVVYHYVNPNNCIGFDSMEVEVHSLPSVYAGADMLICAGNPTNLMAIPSGGASPYTYGWNPAGSLNNAFIQNPIASPVVTTTFTVTVNDIYGCSASDDVVIIATTFPVADAGENDTICFGQSTQLIATGGSSYMWSPGTGLSDSTIANPIASPMVTTTYTVVVTSNCGIALDYVTVIVNPLPGVTLTGINPDVCIDGGIFTLTGTPTGGIFAGPGVVGNTFDPVLAGIGGPYTISYTYTDLNNCTSPATLQVVVHALPAVSITGLPATHCINGGLLTLTGTPAGGTFSGAGVTGNTFDPAVAGLGPHTLTYTYADQWGCINSATGNITVLDLTPVTFTGLVSSYCVSDPIVTLTGTPVGGVFTGPGIVGNTFDPALAGSGIHTITYTISGPGYCTNSYSEVVTVNALPVVSFSGLNADYCITDGTVTLTGSPAGGTFTGNAISGNNFSPANAGIGTHMITYTYTSVSGCTNTYSQATTVHALPVVSFTGLAAQYCVNHGSILLTGIPAGGTFSGPGIIGNIFNTTTAGTGIHTITYTYADIYGCLNSTSQIVTVNVLPNVSFATLAPVCEDVPPFMLAGGNPAGGTYSGNGVIGGYFHPSVAGIGIHPITYTYTEPITGCAASAVSHINVSSKPVANAGADTTILFNTKAYLSGSATGGLGSYTWNWQPSALMFNPNAYYSPTVNLTTSQLFTFTAYDVFTGCFGTDQVLVTVFGSPLDVNINAIPSAICQGASSVLTAISMGGSNNYMSYQWSSVPAGTYPAAQSITVSPSVTTTYQVKVYDGYNYDSTTVTLVVNPLPALAITNLPAGACVNGAPVSLSGTPAGGIFSGLGVSGATFYPNIAGIGSHTITYSYTDGNGCFNTATASIQVYSLPSVNIAYTPSSICINASPLSLTGTPAGGTFSGPGIVGNTFDPSLAGLGTSTFTYTYTDANSCTNSINRNIHVNPLPMVSFSGLAASYCANSPTVTLTGNPAGGTFGGPGVGAGTFSPVVAGVGTHNVTYTYNDANGCTNVATQPVTVHPVPQVAFVGLLTEYCVNASPITLVGNLGGTNFSGSGVTGNQFNPSVPGTGYTTLTYTYTDPVTGCSNSITETVLIRPFSAVSIVAPANACINGTPVTLSGSPSGGTFSGTGVTGTQFNPVTAGLGSHVITYSYTNSYGCTNSTTHTITVQPLPSVSIGGLATSYCIPPSQVVTLAGLPTGGTFSGPGVSGNTFNPQTAGTGVKVVTYTYTDGYGCTNSATASTTVNSTPASFTGLGSAYCENSPPATLTGSTIGSITGTFTGPGIIGNVFNPAIAGVGGHTITYTITNPTTGCTGVATQYTVVHAIPGVYILNLAPNHCVNGPTVTVGVSPSTGGTLAGPGISGTTFNPGVAGVGTHIITYSFTNTNNCTVTDTQIVTVHPVPTVSFSGLAGPYCENDAPIQLTGTPAGGIFSGPGAVGSTFHPGVSHAGTHTITYTYTDANGCSNSANQTVTVYTNPVVNLGPDQIICINHQITLDAGPGATSYLWSTGATTQTILVDSTQFGIGIHTISVTVTNANNCSTVATVKITINPCEGIEEAGNDRLIQVFPNPTTGQFNVLFNNYEGSFEMSVFNELGQVVRKEFIDITNEVQYIKQVDLSTHPTGVYFIRLMNDRTNKVIKVVVNR